MYAAAALNWQSRNLQGQEREGRGEEKKEKEKGKEEESEPLFKELVPPSLLHRLSSDAVAMRALVRVKVSDCADVAQVRCLQMKVIVHGV